MGSRPYLTDVFRRLLIVAWLVLMLNACGDSVPQAEHGGQLPGARLSDQGLSARQALAVSEEKVYRFGFDLRGSAQEEHVGT